MEQSFADRGYGEELIDTKVESVHSMDIQLQPVPSIPLAYGLGISLLIMWKNSNF